MHPASGSVAATTAASAQQAEIAATCSSPAAFRMVCTSMASSASEGATLPSILVRAVAIASRVSRVCSGVPSAASMRMRSLHREVHRLDGGSELGEQHIPVEGEQVDHDAVDAVAEAAGGAALLVLFELLELAAQRRAARCLRVRCRASAGRARAPPRRAPR